MSRNNIFQSDTRRGTFGSGAGGDSGLLNATTSPTKTLPTDGLGIHRMSSFSTDADAALAPPLPLLVSAVLLLLLGAGAARVALSVGACARVTFVERSQPKLFARCVWRCTRAGADAGASRACTV